MTAMKDSELAETTGHGFSEFSFVNGVAMAKLDIRAATYTEIDSMKLGYYDNGSGLGWDQDWTNVQMGSATEDLVFNGFFIRAEFDNYDNPATRRLLSLQIGTQDLSGTIKADFNSFSGDINSAGGQISGNRLPSSFSQITSTGGGFYFAINLEGPNKGITVHFDNATTQ